MSNMSRSLLLIAILSLAAPLGIAQTGPAAFTTVYSFTGQNGDGTTPAGGLGVGNNGTLYGTTEFGGSATCLVNDQRGCGTVFALMPPGPDGGAWTETVLYSFTDQNGDGAAPTAGVAVGADGTLYGTTWGGGTAGFGTVFALQPATQTGGQWTETVLHSFRAVRHGDGAYPYAGLTIGAHGELYGTTEGGSYGKNQGSVFVLTPPAAPGGAWIETELFLFPAGIGPDGCCPYAGVTIGKNAKLYGATPFGSLGGTVFQLTPSGVPGVPWTHTVLSDLDFQGSGGFPQGSLAFGKNGALYGTSYAGGDTTNCVPPVVGCGAVFELSPPATPGGSWTGTTVHEFAGGYYDGANPVAGVVVGETGALYGTTTDGPGTVFRMTPPGAGGGPWTETILHNFTGKNGDGSDPLAPLVFGRNGALFGTTSGGGTAGFGTVFEVRP
jgi:uncharacterized repeat protein (TIGR03803 family)